MSVTRQYTIDTIPEKCTGCRRCQLICSFSHDGEFNLGKARIVIDDKDEGVDEITFTEDCDRCGVCIRYCVYGALRFRQEG